MKRRQDESDFSDTHMAGGAQVKSSLSINARSISSRFPHKVSGGAIHARDKSRRGTRGRERRFVNDNGHGYCGPLGEKERESCVWHHSQDAHTTCVHALLLLADFIGRVMPRREDISPPPKSFVFHRHGITTRVIIRTRHYKSRFTLGAPRGLRISSADCCTNSASLDLPLIKISRK